jgi:SPP1 gp7 family putative phage head morphogenesis protein
MLLKHARHDAAKHPDLPHHLDESRRYGKNILNGPGFRSAVWLAANQTAAQTARQVKEALGHKGQPPDLSKPTRGLADAVFDKTSELVDDAVDRADAVVGEWLDLDPDLSERADDIDALEAMLQDDQDRNTGKALASTALAFGVAFAVMNRDAQIDAGAGSYMWLSQKDSRVRPAHRDLDEEIANWDDPPLKASESDNEEDCAPGDDWGCRCVSSPLTKQDEIDLDLT